jgi:hypothetical protein
MYDPIECDDVIENQRDKIFIIAKENGIGVSDFEDIEDFFEEIGQFQDVIPKDWDEGEPQEYASFNGPGSRGYAAGFQSIVVLLFGEDITELLVDGYIEKTLEAINEERACA